MEDICTAETGLSDAESLAAWNATIRAFLAHDAATPTHLAEVMERAPDFALGHATRGLFCLLLGRREMTAAAREALAACDAALAQGHAPRRARAYRAALDTWLGGEISRAAHLLEMELRSTPRDTLTLKLVHAILFVVGEAAQMRRSVERALVVHGPDHPLSGYAQGCHAFALEETGAYDRAERTGLAGLDAAPDDAWGLHAVAHVHDMTGRPRDGLDLIDSRSGAWLHCNNFRYHVWWHKALLHLDQGEMDTVLALYDTRIRAEQTDDYRDIANAASLLMRLELEGHATGDRWAELADLSEARLDDACLPFADLHYMIALTGDRRADAAHRLLARIRRDGEAAGTEIGSLFAAPGAAAAEGLAAFGEGRYATAFGHMLNARTRLARIGGSHAQRDVFERMTIDAGIRAGYLDQAERILAQRTAQRAGREDSFAAARNATIAAARREALRIAAQ